MFNLRSHGGHCCGISHLDGWDYAWSPINREATRKRLRILGSQYAPFLYEVTLTDQQLVRLEDLGSELLDAGFHLVNRFQNANSTNWVNVLHKCDGKRLEGSPLLEGKVDD